jgi:hypothetical protein
MMRLLNETRHGTSPWKTVPSQSQTTFPSHPEYNYNNNYTKEFRKIHLIQDYTYVLRQRNATPVSSCIGET